MMSTVSNHALMSLMQTTNLNYKQSMCQFNLNQLLLNTQNQLLLLVSKTLIVLSVRYIEIFLTKRGARANGDVIA